MTPVQEAAPPQYTVPEAPQTAPASVGWGPQRGAPTGPAKPARTGLRPGATYRLAVGHEWEEQTSGAAAGLQVELTVPSGGWYLEKGAVVKGEVNDQPDLAGVRALVVEKVPIGGCDRLRRRWVDPGPLPVDLARALWTSFGFEVVAPPKPVTAFGHEGVHLILRLGPEPDAARCLDFNLTTYRSMAWFSEVVELWILDVDGTRVVVERSWFAQTPRHVLDQQHAMLRGLRILSG